MNSNTKSFAEIFTNEPYMNLQKFSDATLKSKDGKIFNIHRMILAPKSKYFRALFNFNDNSKEFSLKNIESHILEQILIFLYTDQLSLKLEHIPDILYAADFLLIDKMVSECSTFVMKNLDILHCISLLKVAWQLDNKALFQHCYKFAQLHFQEVIENAADNIGSLSIETLKMLLAEKRLNIFSEAIIWDAIRTWVNNDLAGRLKFVPEMLTCLNIKNMDESMASNIITSAIVSKNEHCKAINELKSTVMSSQNVLKQHMLLQNKPIFPIDRTRLPMFLNVVVRKRFEKQTNIELLITFDEKIDAYHKICNLDFFPREFLIIGNKLHLYEFTRQCIDDNKFSWDLVENKRTKISHTLISRLSQYDYCAVTSGGKTYCMKELRVEYDIIGVTVECYNPEVDEWTLVAPMPAMSIDSVISCCNEVYAFGRTDASIVSKMLAQKYNPETDTWSLISLPSIERSCTKIARYNDKLLFIGGSEFDEYREPKLIDEYDPVTNSWRPMPKLPVSYIETEIANVDNVLYIYEGEQELDGEPAEPPVFWNEKNQNWQIVTKKSSLFKLENFKFFTIYDPETVKRIIFNRRCQKWIQSSLFN